MKWLRYFAYGSNLHPGRLASRTPSARAMGTTFLAGWSLRFHKRGSDGSAKCNVMHSGNESDCAYGAVYGMEAKDKLVLDRVEGLGRGYEELWLEAPGHGPVFLYVASPTFVSDGLVPFSWYKAYVLAGARYHALPRAYIDEIDRVPTMEDPDQERQKRNWKILASWPGKGPGFRGT